MNRKGQFYLISAMIILVILGSFLSINYFTYDNKIESKIYDLGDEISYESEKVLGYGISSDKEVGNIVHNFTQIYSKTAKEKDMNLYFLFGNKNKLTLVNYGDDEGKDVHIKEKFKVDDFVKDYVPQNDTNIIVVKIKEEEYEFELNPGELFYFLISYEEGEERYVFKK